MQFYHSITAGV